MKTVIFLILAYTGGILSEKLRNYYKNKKTNYEFYYWKELC